MVKRVDAEIEDVEGLSNRRAKNFQHYPHKHQHQIPSYQQYHTLTTAIASGLWVRVGSKIQQV